MKLKNALCQAAPPVLLFCMFFNASHTKRAGGKKENFLLFLARIVVKNL